MSREYSESMHIGTVPDKWLYSYLSPLLKLDKINANWRALYGKVIEKINASLSVDLENAGLQL